MEDFWLSVGDRVSHIKDNTWVGTVTEIDDNLISSGVTTCRVEWEGEYEPDILWTNKLVKLED